MSTRVTKTLSSTERGIFSNWQRDMAASVVVFLVALPLCMGIAIASGAPPAAAVESDRRKTAGEIGLTGI